MRSHGLTTLLSVWLDRRVNPPIACADECFTKFVKMTWPQAPRSGTPSQREAAALLFPTVVGASRDANSALDPTDLTFTSAPVGSQLFALEGTAGFKIGDAIIIDPDDITSSCGLRVLVSRGGITFAAASSQLAPFQVNASETDVRTLSVRLDPCGERAAFSDAVHKLEEHALQDVPIQGPRTTHWLLLEIARGEQGPVARHHWWKQAMGLSSSDPRVDVHFFLCVMLGHGTQYDQLNLPELALGEAVSRRLQLWE